MNEVEQQFTERAVKRGGLLFFSRETDLEVIQAGQRADPNSWASTAFTGMPRLPSMEHISDVPGLLRQEDAPAAAKAFLLGQTEPLHFEVIFD